MALGAAMVFIVTALYQPDVALALVILGLVFIPLEWIVTPVRTVVEAQSSVAR